MLSFFHNIAAWFHSLTFVPFLDSDDIGYYLEGGVAMEWGGVSYELPLLLFVPAMIFLFLLLLTFIDILLKILGIVRPRRKKGFWETFWDVFHVLLFNSRFLFFFGIYLVTGIVLLVRLLIEVKKQYGGIIGLLHAPMEDICIITISGLLAFGGSLIALKIVLGLSEGIREFIRENIEIWGRWGIVEAILAPCYLIIWIIMILLVTASAFILAYPLIMVIAEYVVCALLLSVYILFYSGMPSLIIIIV